ncbi:LOW QUALITY PROTEIN: mucin-4 [Erethizon dorsatum]
MHVHVCDHDNPFILPKWKHPGPFSGATFSRCINPFQGQQQHTLSDISGGRQGSLHRLCSRKHGGHIPACSDTTLFSTSSVGISATPTHEYPKTVRKTPSTADPRTSPVKFHLEHHHAPPRSHLSPVCYQPLLTIHTILRLHREGRNLSTLRGSHSAPASSPVKPTPGVSLFPYGTSEGNQRFVRRTVDFTSWLFRIKIGFPLGSSLWDSFYFTDNGQIFFPESDYQIFPYSNPPPGGFTGRDTVATVAAFWGDADFSIHSGTIFYQVGLSKPRHPHVCPPPPHTNTYQAILSTDGSRSYALFLYQSGGGCCDVAQHQGNSVLMGFSSGDGYFENSPLISRPLWEKYRPDQFLDPKLGVQGLQIRLHREEKSNFRLRCLQRLSSLWPSWTPRLIFCPCSWQQGRWDLRFQTLSIDDIFKPTHHPLCLGPRFPVPVPHPRDAPCPPHLSTLSPPLQGRWGPRGQYLCSFSSWRSDVCRSYGPWGEFQKGWSLQSLELLHWELETQNWCCHWNDKPSFCALYCAQWPRIGCAAYRPPRPAWMFGDRHIFTLNGTNFTFNGLRDFLLVQAQDSNSSFLLQGHTAQTGSTNATNFIAFAAQYKACSLDPVTVQFLLGPNDMVHVLHNNQNVTFETSREDAKGIEMFNATGVLLTPSGSLVSASFDGMVTISVTALSNILHTLANFPEEYWNTEGLLGVWNDNPEDDFRMPNGSSVPRNSSEETLFHYGMTCTLNGTVLLGTRGDPLPSNFTTVFFSQLWANHSLASGCDGDKQCIYDTMATGDTCAGLHTRGLFRAYQLMNATLSTCVITKNGTLLWTPKLPEPVTLEILARDTRTGLSSVLQPKMVACFCSATSQCLYNQTRRAGNSSFEETSCQCNEDTFGRHCECFKDPCDERCFPNVQCTPGRGCGACPPNMTGDGRHCAALFCHNESCPVNYCYNHGHCHMSQNQGCRPTCTCPLAFTDRCFLAGNTFVPSILRGMSRCPRCPHVHLAILGEAPQTPKLPVRSIQLSLHEEENATKEDVNASVAYRLEHLDVRAFLRNSHVERVSECDCPFPAPGFPPTSPWPPEVLTVPLPCCQAIVQPCGRSIQHWKVVSEFKYCPRGPVIHFLNKQLLDAVVSAFLPQAGGARRRRRAQARNYEGYRLVCSPQNGVTCVSPCSEGHCQHGGQCQHLPDGPCCSCLSFSIYTSWGKRCEPLSLKLGAFFGILFGSLCALLLLGVIAWVALRPWSLSRPKFYPLPSEN